MAAWRRYDDQLRQLGARAEEPWEPAETPAGLPVPLDDGEVVVTVQPAAELVEVTARHVAGLPAPGLTVVPVEETDRSPRLPKGVALVDAGMAVVTDRRLILVGRGGHREWPYEELTGVAHDPEEPFTLLHTNGRGRLRGIRVPRSVASAFRLHLTLAYAEAIGAQDELLDQLDEELVAHSGRRPAVPAAATPADAPASARLTRPALVAAVAVLVALAAVAGTVRWSTGDRPVVGMDLDGGPAAGSTESGEPTPSTGLGAPVASATPTLGPGATGTPVPGSSPGSVPGAPTSGPGTTAGPTGGGTVGNPSARPTSTRTGGSRPSPSTSPSPSRSPGDLCGAPENPYGYNYCGGSRIYTPAADVCSYFTCVDGFWDGNGYMVLCNDGLVSMTGMGSQPCGGHGGTKQDVYV